MLIIFLKSRICLSYPPTISALTLEFILYTDGGDTLPLEAWFLLIFVTKIEFILFQGNPSWGRVQGLFSAPGLLEWQCQDCLLPSIVYALTVADCCFAFHSHISLLCAPKFRRSGGNRHFCDHLSS